METNNTITYGNLIVGNDYFQIIRGDLSIEKIKITEKENGRYSYKSDNRTNETCVVKYHGKYVDSERLYDIFTNAEEAKQMAIKLFIERMSKY